MFADWEPVTGMEHAGTNPDFRKHVNQAPWLMILPILCVIAMVLALNALGDGLEDPPDPVMRR